MTWWLTDPWHLSLVQLADPWHLNRIQLLPQLNWIHVRRSLPEPSVVVSVEYLPKVPIKVTLYGWPPGCSVRRIFSTRMPTPLLAEFPVTLRALLLPGTVRSTVPIMILRLCFHPSSGTFSRRSKRTPLRFFSFHLVIALIQFLPASNGSYRRLTLFGNVTGSRVVARWWRRCGGEVRAK